MSKDWYQDVYDFHKKFGIYFGENGPEVPDETTIDLRWALIEEEVNKELESAVSKGDLVGIADGIADAIYVLLGTAISYGIDLRPIWDMVQEANMSKTGGKKREDGKLLKPEGWISPEAKIDVELTMQIRNKE